MTSAPASTSARQRSRSLGRVPMAAPTSSCLFESFEASGNSFDFFMSVIASDRDQLAVGGEGGALCAVPVREINATISPAAFTTGSLPFLDCRINSFASVKDTPSRAVGHHCCRWTSL